MMYTDRGLYSPDIVFEKDGRFVKCDVITVAAPNKAAAMTENPRRKPNL